MKGKKLITLLLVLVLAVSVMLAGCGKTDEPAPAEDKGQQEEKAPDNNANKGKALKLKVEIFDRGNSPQGSTMKDNPIANWIVQEVKESTNVEVEFVSVPRSEEVAKLNVMMASSTAPDIVFTYNQDLVANYAKNGGLTDLEPYIEQFGPEIKKNFGDFLQYGQFYGKQYAITGKGPVTGAAHVSYIRKDWVEKLGAELPTNKEEVFTLLRRFKEEDPGNVGKDNVVPYAMAAGKTEKYYENFVLSYADKLEEKDFYIYDEYLRIIRPGTKEGYRKLNELYNQDLISPDFALDTSEKQYKQDIASGLAGFFTDDRLKPVDQGWITALQQNVEGGELWPVNCFENAEGEYYRNAGSRLGLRIMVPKANEKNAEAAIKYLNWMADMKNYANIKYAMEGVNFKYDEQGIPEFTTTMEDREKQGIAKTYMNDYAILYRNLDFGSQDKNKLLDVKKYQADYPEELISTIWNVRFDGIPYDRPYFTIPVEADSKFGPNLKTVLREMAAKVIICTPAQFDQVWESEYNKFMEAGGSKVYEERASIYDEMKGKK